MSSSALSATKRISSNARQSPPVRLSELVYNRVQSHAAMEMRTVPKQIEYLIALGEKVAQLINREDLLNIQSGFARLVVERIESDNLSADDLLGDIDRQRASGTLTQAVTGADVVYQASTTHAGQIERINTKTGKVDIGTFSGGKFRKMKTTHND